MIKSKALSIAKFCIFFMCMIGALYFQNEIVIHAQTLPDVPSEVIDSNLEKVQGGGTAIQKFNRLVQRIVIPNVKHIFVAFSILILLYYVFQFIIATDSESIEAQKKNLLWAAIGFALIGISLRIVEAIAPQGANPGGIDNTATIGSVSETGETIRLIMLYIQYLAGGAAFLFMVIAAVRIITSQGIEDEINKQKKNFTWGALGLITIMIARVAVESVYSVEGETVTPGDIGTQGSAELIGIIRFVLQYVGIAAIGALILAGVYYIISLGEEEQTNRAKKIIMWTIIAIVIIYSAYSIVAYVARPPSGELL